MPEKVSYSRVCGVTIHHETSSLHVSQSRRGTAGSPIQSSYPECRLNSLDLLAIRRPAALADLSWQIGGSPGNSWTRCSIRPCNERQGGIGGHTAPIWAQMLLARRSAMTGALREYPPHGGHGPCDGSSGEVQE